MTQRICGRCGRPFQPEKPHYRLCDQCFQDTQSVGFTRVNRRGKGADHRQGGVSRLYDGRRTVTLHGDETRKNVLGGHEAILDRPLCQACGVSTLLVTRGMSEAEIAEMDNGRVLDNFVMDLCPKLDEWFRNDYGQKFADVLIDHYGLYGNRPVTLDVLAQTWSFTDVNHAQNYVDWALRELGESRPKLERIVFGVANTLIMND